MTENQPLHQKEEIGAEVEYTIALIKPNGVCSGMVGFLRQELLDQGFEIVAEEEIIVGGKEANLMYSHLGDKARPIIDHITSGPSHAFVIRGVDAIRKLREAVGCTQWKDRPAKGLRGRYGFDFIQNTIHAPDCRKEAAEEFHKLIPDITETFLNETRLSDEFNSFLAKAERIKSNERILNPYCFPGGI